MHNHRPSSSTSCVIAGVHRRHWQSQRIFFPLIVLMTVASHDQTGICFVEGSKQLNPQPTKPGGLKNAATFPSPYAINGGVLKRNRKNNNNKIHNDLQVQERQETSSNILPVQNTTTVESSSPDKSPIVDEVTSKEDDPRILMLIRLLFLSYYGSLGSLLPYLPVYYHSLGHGGQVIGMLGAIKPFTTFLVAPLWGIVSDQAGSPFPVLYFTFLVSLVGQLLVAWKHNPTYIMFMVFITAFFNAPVKSLLDSMVMDHLNDRSRYGRLRLWGQLGFGIGSSGVGFLLSQSKHRAYNPTHGATTLELIDHFWQSLTGYKLLFLSYAALSVPTWICIRAFHRLHNEKEAEKIKQNPNLEGTTKKSVGFWSGISLLFQSGDAMLFFFLVFVVGVSSGLIENFAYVRIREVGGTGKDMGLSRLVSSIAGAPMFWFSGPLTEALGADKVIVLSLLSYVTRFINYALMRNPLQGLPAEALRGLTFAAFWSTGTIYASRIAPPGMGATMLMFLNAMYGGLGQSLGAIIGGKLQSKFGTVKTYLYAAIFDFCFICLVVAYLKMRTGSGFQNPTPLVPQQVAAEEVETNEVIMIQEQEKMKKHDGKDVVVIVEEKDQIENNEPIVVVEEKENTDGVEPVVMVETQEKTEYTEAIVAEEVQEIEPPKNNEIPPESKNDV